jgi:hypothetical protein
MIPGQHSAITLIRFVETYVQRQTEVIVGTVVVGQEVHRVARHGVFGLFVHEICMGGKGVGGRERELLSLPWWRTSGCKIPRTEDRSDSIIRADSYNAIVKPESLDRAELTEVCPTEDTQGQTNRMSGYSRAYRQMGQY